ncbi:flagellar assembly protein FliW [Clostridiaceae bacterium UIB06]|uniref:Flagellar assembly factor FliW n=1 Tax=Clostridium thailandense TaxID=2794346 RepID=A0A949TVK9_9CLOT|nr:flagellar assembly protein FliW [Clostridium thailandense]MBV7272260.1 flagellar assembly protein FliW [Clostridium thailandense]MCH5137806.1 flagellar assembly protein FliW [Clostridiaceae bacterium UIB06]
MKLNTKYHGEKEYDENDIITFEKGIPGFEHLRKFILFPVEENEVFNILHSIEDESIGLIVVSPFFSIKEYEFDLDEQKLKELKIETEGDVLVLNTVTLDSDVSSITVNLKAPIIINTKEKVGEQIILDNPNYAIKHLLFGNNSK